MQYKAKQSKQSKDRKRAKGVGLEEPRYQHLTVSTFCVDWLIDCVNGRMRTSPLHRWRSRQCESEWSTSANRSWTSALASWSRSRRSRSRACSRSWTRSTRTSGCASSSRTWPSASCCSSSAGSVRRSGRSRTACTVRRSQTTSQYSTVSGFHSALSCDAVATSVPGYLPTYNATSLNPFKREVILIHQFIE